MIRDRKLTYHATPSPLQELEFESAVLNTIVIAILTTVLSYQAASLAFDLFFGIKSPDKARISDIHILLLTRQSSPLFEYASILRLDWLTRLQFRGDVPKDEAVVRDRNRVHISVAGKLVFLLAVVPLLNVGSIVLNFTRQEIITFGEAEFGGTALDVNADISVVEVEPLTRRCDEVVIETAKTDRSNVTFSLCEKYPAVTRSDNERLNGSATVVIQRCRNMMGVITVSVGRHVVVSNKYADVSINDTLAFRLRSTLSRASAKPLVDHGIDLLARKCLSENPITANVTETTGADGGPLVGRVIVCDEFADDESRIADEVITELTGRITLVDAELFELEKTFFNGDGCVDTSRQEFFHGDEYPFVVKLSPM